MSPASDTASQVNEHGKRARERHSRESFTPSKPSKRARYDDDDEYFEPEVKVDVAGDVDVECASPSTISAQTTLIFQFLA